MSSSIFNSLQHAFRGLKIVIKTERNFRVFLLAAFLVVLIAWYKQLSDVLWVGLLLIIAFILVLEIFNSAIERLVDILAPKTHNFAKEIKDLLAAMVLLASLFAVVIGLIVFF